MSKPIPALFPCTLTADEANALLECRYTADGGMDTVHSPRELPSKIADIILEEELTPLQVQAALVAAWGRILNNGRISLPRRKSSIHQDHSKTE